uniref:CxxxxCH/CxxCH domain-containing protein n=1 Tax=Symmachiella macrocystis TaxID=2527985 RepID=UPI0011B510A4
MRLCHSSSGKACAAFTATPAWGMAGSIGDSIPTPIGIVSRCSKGNSTVNG